MSDIFREVDEDLKRDKLDVLWAKYGSSIIGAAIVFVIVIAGSIGWSNYQVARQARLSDEYIQAENLAVTGRIEETLAAFAALAGKTTSGYKTLSMFQTANLLLSDGKTQEAVVVFDEIAARGTGDTILRDLAKLNAAWALADSASYVDIQARMTDLSTSDSPWRASAQELLAYAALQSGDLDAARIGYGGLVNNRDTPQGMAQRASAMLTIMGPATLPVVKETEADAIPEDMAPAEAEPVVAPAAEETP